MSGARRTLSKSLKSEVKSYIGMERKIIFFRSTRYLLLHFFKDNIYPVFEAHQLTDASFSVSFGIVEGKMRLLYTIFVTTGF